MLNSYVLELCDKYAHYGEYLAQEFKDMGKSKRGICKHGVSQSMFSLVFAGKRNVGAEFSRALGEYLGAPVDHYEKLGRLFIAEKKRRSKL